MQKIHKIALSAFVLSTLTINTTAFAVESTQDPTFTPADITLQAELNEKAAKLNWEISNGTAPNGFKIVWSLFPNPEFPIRDNDYFDSAPLPSASERLINYFLNKGKYYARVCIYDGAETCVKYSNQITFDVAEIPATVEGENAMYEVTEILENGSGTGTDESLDSGTTDDTSNDELPTVPELTLPEDINSSLYKKGITYMYQHGIVSGYPDGTFKPDNKINRAEFTKIIIEAAVPTTEIEACLASHDETALFSDIGLTDWYSKYICIAKDKGIISGYPDGSFQPAQEITFVEATKIITLGMEENVPESSPWYKAYVETLAEKHIIPPTISNASHIVTRAEMSEMIYRLRENLTDEPYLMYEEVIKEI